MQEHQPYASNVNFFFFTIESQVNSIHDLEVFNSYEKTMEDNLPVSRNVGVFFVFYSNLIFYLNQQEQITQKRKKIK